MLRKRLLTLAFIILLGPAGVLIADPVLEVSWSEEIGFPEFIDWNRAFMDVFNGGPYSITVTIQNAGDTDLIIEDITCEEQEFYADPTNLILEPDQSSDVRFIFNAREPGEYESVMQIIWNSPDGEVFGIPVIGEADGPPDMEWDVGPIEEDMLTGEIVQRVFTIDNDGGTPLRFQIYHEIIGEPDRDNAVRSIRRSVGNQNGPRRDDPGDLIDQFEIPNGGRRLYNSGLAWDSENNWMWITQWEVPFRAIAIDPREDFAVAAEFNVPGGCMAADYYNGTIFIVNWPNGWLFRFNSDGENLGNLDVPIQPTAMSINQEEGWLLLMDADDNHDIVVYDLENNLDVIGRIDTYSNLIQNNTSRGINWVEKHPDGQLWMNTNNNGNVAWQIAVDEDDDFQCNEVVQSFQTHAGAAQEWDGLGHDGENLWSTSWGSAQCRIFEDGVEEVSWLSYEPAEGVIEPGGSVDITVTIDAIGLWGGDYEADLIVLTNDPANPEIVVNVFVFVSCPINIWIEWDPGFPDVVDWNIAFEELFAGGPYTVPMEIINTSMDLLIVEDIISDHDYFIPTFQDVIEIEPGRSAHLDLVFNAPADDPGNYDAVLTFVSNDQDGDLEIELHAECSLPPIVVWEPDEVEDILLNFEVNEHEITISNEGDALLRWEADLEINRGPDRDFDARKIRSIESQSGPRRDHAGEQVAQFAGANVPNQYWSPVGWDEENELMFVTSYSAEQIVVYSHNDYEDFEEVRRWEMPTPMDGAWYNGTLYAKQHGEHFLHRWDS
ncbi:MAG: hypothetical protein HN356_15235, partial [Calditrichaeota bacterium]|nr:hypothetical protein [Calditrichota bacterium]